MTTASNATGQANKTACNGERRVSCPSLPLEGQMFVGGQMREGRAGNGTVIHYCTHAPADRPSMLPGCAHEAWACPLLPSHIPLAQPPAFLELLGGTVSTCPTQQRVAHIARSYARMHACTLMYVYASIHAWPRQQEGRHACARMPAGPRRLHTGGCTTAHHACWLRLIRSSPSWCQPPGRRQGAPARNMPRAGGHVPSPSSAVCRQAKRGRSRSSVWLQVGRGIDACITQGGDDTRWGARSRG
mgnify:CR=1 FL=1